MAQNLISAEIPQSVIDKVNSQLQEIITELKPYTKGLSTEERRSVVKRGDKSVAYADKVHTYISTNDDYLPRRINKAEFEKDYAIPKALHQTHILLQQAFELVDDTILAAGSDIMEVCNSYYNSVRDAAEKGEPGAKAIYADLKARYPGRPSKYEAKS